MATPAQGGTNSNSNSSLLAQAQQAAGTQVTGAATVSPASDISQVPAGAIIYWGGNITTQAGSSQGGGKGKQLSAGPGNPGGLPNNAQTNLTSTSPKDTQTLEQTLQYFYSNIASDPTALRQFVSETALAGLTNTNASVQQAYAAWEKLVTESYNYTISGGKQLSPYDVLANSIPVSPTGVGTSKGGGGAGSYANNSGQTYLQGLSNTQINQMVSEAQTAQANDSAKNSVTSVDINYTDPDTARYILNQTYQQYLGRAPSNQEIAAFTTALNANEKEFPKSSTSVFTPAPGTSNSGTASTVPVPDSGSTGTTVVGYDSSGNPIFGPTTSVGSTGSAPGTETTTSLGEADYTRYGRQQLATDYAQADPNYGAYQAAGPLFQAFLSALKPAVSGVGSNS